MNAKQYKCAKRIRWQLKMDAPAVLSIATAAALCVFATALAYDPGGITDPALLEDPSVKDGEMLLALYESAEMYRNGGQGARAEEQEEMFRHKLAEVAQSLLGVEVSSTFTDYFVSGIPDWEDRSGQICGSASDIPAHLAKVHGVEWYGAFMEKYSIYPIELVLHDERPKLGFHYGFIAASGDEKYASTYLHVDPCTGTVTDAESYLLTCRNEESGYFFSTKNQSDIAASLKLEDFCVIPIGQWRQSLYDYADKISGKVYRHDEGGVDMDDYDDYVAHWREVERLRALENLAYYAASDSFTDDAMQEKIQKYRDIHGALPDDFLNLLEGRDGE